MARKSELSAYEKSVGALEGDDFQDEVCTRLAGQVADFQRIPAKPSGDGGLDGLSHGQTCGYCCYGPEQEPFKVNIKGLKDDIVKKFSADLRKLFELTIGENGRLVDSPNQALADIIGEGNKIKNIYCVVSWFESHRVIGTLNTAFKRYKKASQFRFLDPDAALTIWGPKDLATRGAIDEHTLFRMNNRALFKRVEAASAAILPPQETGDFDAKFEDLKQRRPGRATDIDGLARGFREAWAAAIALDNELASTSVALHEALEKARTDAALSARLRSLRDEAPYEMIEAMRLDVADRLGQSFGQRLGGLTTKVADGVVAGLIGECPVEWRSTDG